MLKTAYAIGYQKAIQDFGTEKTAFFGKALSGLISKGGRAGQAGQWALKNPIASKTIAGAGIGGTAGAIGGDEGGFMRGALGGAAAGAGAGLGGRAGLKRWAEGAGALGAGALGYGMARGFVPGHGRG